MSGVQIAGCSSKTDPRDMSRVFVRRPSGNLVDARYADLTLPSVTLHEALAARRALLAKGRQEANTRTIFGTAIEQRILVDAAVKATATARPGHPASAAILICCGSSSPSCAD
jgi:putative transposase